MPLTFWVRRGNEGQRGGEREGECIGIGGKEDAICLCLDLDLGSDVFVCLWFLVIFSFFFVVILFSFLQAGEIKSEWFSLLPSLWLRVHAFVVD